MARKKNSKLDFETMGDLSHSPFAGLGKSLGIKGSDAKPAEKAEKAEPKPEASPDRAMLMVRMEKRKHGKVVTRVYHLNDNPKQWLKKLKQKLGSGGSLVEDALEIQGDHRDTIIEFFQDAGFKVRRGN